MTTKLLNRTPLQGPLYAALLAALLPAAVNATTEADMINYLKQLDLAELAEVEASLDEAFDIFGGLLSRKQVKVASGVSQSTARAPAVTTVITAQDIEATGANDLDEVLRGVPGLYVSMDSIYTPIYSIRGMYSLTNPEVLLLVNGVSMKTVTAGNRGQGWGGMPVRNIARIEVIRGPGSAVYGADAFSGVINIITKTRADIKGTEAGGRVGSYNSYDGWVLHGAEWAGLEVAAALEYRNTDGHGGVVESDAQSGFDRRFGSDASRAPGPVNLARDNLDARLDVAKGHWRARAGYQGRYDLGTGAGAARNLDPVGSFNDHRYTGEVVYHNPTLTRNWNLSAELNYTNRQFSSHDLNLFPPGSKLPPAPGMLYPDGVLQWHSLDEHYLRGDVSAFYTGFDSHVLRLGAGYWREEQREGTYFTNRGLGLDGKPIPPGAGVVDLTDSPYGMPEETRNNWHAFIQDTWALGDNWELTGGLRYDDYSDFGSTTNPRLALVWRQSADLTAKLMYGRAFRAPSFREMYVRNNIFTGNPELSAEVVSTWELAFDYRAAANLNLGANLFRYRIQDKITYLPVAGSTLLLASNSGEQDGKGFELEARWKINPKSSLVLNYSHARNQLEDGQGVGVHPRHMLYARADWMLVPAWYLNAQANWVSDREREAGDSRPPIKDYTTVDLTLRYKDRGQQPWNLAAGVRNLFDAEVREPSVADLPNDLPQAGRNWFIEASYRF